MADNGMDRREFMKSTAAGFGGFFFLSANEKKPEETTKKPPKEQKFIYRTLGKTGIKLPAINMGVMNSSNPNLVRAALNSGMVLLDTATTYQRGTNETMIGEVIKERPRDSYVIATKAHPPENREYGTLHERGHGRRLSKENRCQPEKSGAGLHRYLPSSRGVRQRIRPL